MRTWCASAVAALLLSTASTTSRSQDVPLKLEIKTSETVVHNNRIFVVNMTIRNSSNVEQVLQTSQCSFGDWNWATDTPIVHVKQPEILPCKKNPVVYVKLKPGETYEKALSTRVSVPTTAGMPQTVTFRIGFEPLLGYGLSTEPPPHVWSNPITIRIEE